MTAFLRSAAAAAAAAALTTDTGACNEGVSPADDCDVNCDCELVACELAANKDWLIEERWAPAGTAD